MVRGIYWKHSTSHKEDIESDIEYCKERLAKAQSDVDNEEYSIERAEKALEEVTTEILEENNV
jgi:chromosome segregation ATPase